MASVKTIVSPVIGAVVGAVIVGGIWYGTHAAASHNSIVAKVGNTAIRQDTLMAKSEDYAGSSMLSELISDQLIKDAAAKQKVTVTTKQVNQALQSLEAQNGITSDAQLTEVLAQNNMTKAQLLDELKVELLAEKMAENKVKVTDKQIQNYYNKNKKSLASPKKVTLSDIVVKTKAEAQSLQQQLNKGADFATLAKKNSTDSSTKKKGGAMGTFTQSDLSQSNSAIATTAFKLNKGEVSAPIKVSSGYELIKVTAIQPSKIPTLAAAKSTITKTLKQQNMESEAQLVADLMKKENVQILNSKYSSVKDSLENPQPSSSSSIG